MPQTPFYKQNSSTPEAGHPFFASALTDSSYFAQEIFENGHCGFIEWKPLHNSFVFSPSFSTLLGYQSAQLPLNVAAIAAHIFCDDYAKVKMFFANTLLSGKDGSHQFRMVKEDASVSWFLLQINIKEHDRLGQVACAIVNVTNIDDVIVSVSETKSLADDEHWLRLTIRKLLQRQDDNALDDCLNQFCNRVGLDHVALRQAYREGERYRLIAKGHHQQMSESLDFSMTILRKHMPFEFSGAEKGEPVLIDDFTQMVSLSPTFKTRAKELNIRSLATIPIFYQGNIDYYLSLIMSTTACHWQQSTVQLAKALGDALAQVAARRSITQTLEQNEERFQNALEACQDGIWDWDLTQDSFFVTPSFLYMLGYDEEFLPLNRGKISKLLFAPTTLNDFFCDTDRKQGRIDQVMQLRHRNGQPVWIWLRAKHTEWDADGKATRVVGVNVDITRFQNKTSTELRTPANTVVSQNTNPTPKNFTSSLSLTEKQSNLTQQPLTIDEALQASNILLAEDNPINQQVATGILKRKGVKVTIVNNGQEAVEILQSSPPNSFDLVLMDMEMPVLDGYAATQLLRNNTEFKHLPIIALTAHARDEDRENCLNLGMNDHVAKPVKPDILYAAIAKQLEQRNQAAHH